MKFKQYFNYFFKTYPNTLKISSAISLFLTTTISVATIGLVGAVTGIGIVLKAQVFWEDAFYELVNIIILIIFIMLLVVTLCLNFLMVYKNFNSITVFKTIERLSTTLKIKIKGLNFSYRALLFGLVFFYHFFSFNDV